MRPPAPAPTSSALLTDAIDRHGPLPDELPAAALWWRLAGTLEPPTLAAANTGLRPAWTPELHRLLGSRIAETVIADPAWPSLVTAVAASGWEPRDLLAAAAEHLRDIAETEHLRPDEYARLLTYRVELLTHHAATIDPDIPHPAEAAERSAPAEPGERLDLFNDVEPPPDPDDYPYSYAEDTLDGLDFTDLPRHRPTPSAPASTPTSPRCAPSARPPTNTLPSWPRRSCAATAPPKSRPPANSPNYTNATSSSVTTSMTSPTPTATGSAPNTPPKYTVRCWISSPPRSAPPTHAGDADLAATYLTTATSWPSTPPTSTPPSPAPGKPSTPPAPP